MGEEMRNEVASGAPEGTYFTIDIEEVVITRVGSPADHLVVELWRPGQPLKTMRAY